MIPEDTLYTGGELLGSFNGIRIQVTITGKTPKIGKFVIIQKDYSSRSTSSFKTFLSLRKVKVFGRTPEPKESLSKPTNTSEKLIVGALAGCAFLLILVAAVALYFYKWHNRASEETNQDDDVNPEYGLYVIHDDPVAEVVDTCEDYALPEDPCWEAATKVKDNNSTYSGDN